MLRVGAESIVSIVLWRGRQLIKKHRIPKRYRRSEIDERIRKSRTIHEAKVMTTLSENGVPVPVIIFLDMANSSIYMQRIMGMELRDYLAKDGWDGLDVAEDVGAVAGLTHKLSISHGDLTLSNIMVGESGGLWLIDFGLSLYNATLEEMGVDVHLLERSVVSTFPGLAAEFMSRFTEGYGSVVGEQMVAKIFGKVAEIRRRGRYVERRSR
ncbi:MAG: Kae1-associated kinase Bud32 [Nitrososphaerota archaeon]